MNKRGRPNGVKNKEREYEDDLLRIKYPKGMTETDISIKKDIKKQQLNLWKKRGITLKMVATYDLWDCVDFENVPECYEILFDRMICYREE